MADDRGLFLAQEVDGGDGGGVLGRGGGRDGAVEAAVVVVPVGVHGRAVVGVGVALISPPPQDAILQALHRRGL